MEEELPTCKKRKGADPERGGILPTPWGLNPSKRIMGLSRVP